MIMFIFEGAIQMKLYASMCVYLCTSISFSVSLSLTPRGQRVQFKKQFPGTLPLSLIILTIFLYLFSLPLSGSPSDASLPPSSIPFFCGQKACMVLWSALSVQTPSKAGCVTGPHFCRETACLNLQPDSVPFPGPG